MSSSEVQAEVSSRSNGYVKSTLTTASNYVTSIASSSTLVANALNVMEQTPLSKLPQQLGNIADTIDSVVLNSYNNTYDQLVKQYNLVVDKKWFLNMELLLNNQKEKFFNLASETFTNLKDKELKSEFVSTLQKKLDELWNNNLLLPANRFYAVSLEYYYVAKSNSQAKFNDLKQLSLDYPSFYNDVRTKLGAAWEAQANLSFQSSLEKIGNPTVYVYNLLVENYSKLPKEATYLAWIESSKLSLGLFWDERLNPYLNTWWEGAKASENVQKIKQTVASFKVTDLFRYMYTFSLVVAKNGVDYLLPAGEQSSEKPEDLTVGYLVNTTTSRLNEKVVSNYEILQKVDILAYSTRVLDNAKAVVKNYPASLNEYVNQGTESLNQLKKIVEARRATLTEQVNQKVESSQSYLLSTYALVKIGSTNALNLANTLYQSPAALPRASLVFIIQGLGLQAKDDGFEDAVTYLQTLMTSLKQIVAVAPVVETVDEEVTLGVESNTTPSLSEEIAEVSL